MGQNSSDLGGRRLVEACRKAVEQDKPSKLAEVMANCSEEVKAAAVSGELVVEDCSGASLLSYAVACESPACVEMLVQEGARVSTASNRTGMTPLHIACSPAKKAEKRVRCLELLLHRLLVLYENRASAEAERGRPPAGVLDCLCDQDGDGRTVLMLGVTARAAPAIDRLLQLKAMVRGSSSPIAEEHRNAAEKDLDSSLARMLTLTDFSGTPPLHVLVRDCCTDAEEGRHWIELTGRFADANVASLFATDPAGRTALHLAAITSDRSKCFKKLILVGSPLLATNLEGRTVLHEVCRKNYYRGVRQILSSKTLSPEDRVVLISARDARQRSTLLLSLMGEGDGEESGHPLPPDTMLVRLLVKYCPSIGDYRDSDGISANTYLKSLIEEAKGDQERLEAYREVQLTMRKGRQHNPPEGRRQVPSFQLQLCSDLHIEFGYDYSGVVEPSCKYLALLGDIGLATTDSYREFVRLQADRFEKVFVIAGNHEFYKSSLQDTKESLEALCSERDNLVFMNQTSVMLEGVRFLGCTLWSFIPEEHTGLIEGHMSDYRRITVVEEKDRECKLDEVAAQDGANRRRLRVQDTVNLHNSDVEWLNTQISAAEEAGETVVVLTHHSPILFKGCGNPRQWVKPVVHGFGTDLSSLFNGCVKLWAYGHTHWHHDMLISSCRILSNPRGYETESVRTASFSSQFCVTIPKPNE